MTNPLICSIIVGIGGALGANARYWIGSLLNSRFDPSATTQWSLFGQWSLSGQWSLLGIPWGTLAVNLGGSLLLGFLAVRLSPGSLWYNPIAVGFIGAFTTFSAFSYETFTMLQHDAIANAFLYVAFSIIFGLGAVYAGTLLGKL